MTKKEDNQFQVGCVSFLNLKQNKAFKEKVYNCLYSQFDSKISTQMRKTIKQDNTHLLDPIMFHKNRK